MSDDADAPQSLVAAARTDLVRELALVTSALCLIGGGLFLLGVTILAVGIPLTLTAAFVGGDGFSVATFVAAFVIAVFGAVAYLIGRAERRDFERQRTLAVTIAQDGLTIVDRAGRVELGWEQLQACYSVRVGVLRRRELWVETEAFDPTRDHKPGPFGRWRGCEPDPLGRTVVPIDRLSVPDYEVILAIREYTDHRYPGPEREYRTMWLWWGGRNAPS